MAGHLERHISSVEARLAELERRMNVNAFELQKKVEELGKFEERAKINFLDIEKKFATIEELPSSPSEREVVERVIEKPLITGAPTSDSASLEHKFDEKLRSIEDLLMLLELEVVKTKDHAKEPMQELLHPGVPKELEDKVAALEDKVQMIEKLKIKIPAERLNLEERIRSIEDNFLSLEARTKEEINRMDTMVAGKALTEESVERYTEKMHDRIEELRRDVDRAQLLKNELFQREKDFAKRSDFDDFQNFVQNEIVRLKQNIDRVAALERSIDTHLLDIEEKVRSEVQKHSSNWKADIAGHKRDVDLAVIKIEEKILSSLSEEIKRIEQTMNAQRAEIENLLRAERQAERELEARATRIVTKELAEFASLMDKRFPHMVSRSEFDKLNAEILARVQRIEAPDTRPMLQRLQEMEKRTEDFYRILQQIASRMPLVME